MRRAMLVLVALAGLVGLAGPASAAPAPRIADAAAVGWQDAATPSGVSTFYVQVPAGHNIIKVVAVPQYFFATPGGTSADVTAVKGRCSARILDAGRVSGVRIDDCAIGFYGGNQLRGCDPTTCPGLSGTGCCANSYTTFFYVDDTGLASFRVRVTFSWRDRTNGQLVGPGNLLGGGTSSLWHVQ